MLVEVVNRVLPSITTTKTATTTTGRPATPKRHEERTGGSSNVNYHQFSIGPTTWETTQTVTPLEQVAAAIDR
eukprot:2249775-Amphidinium_carterae.1